MTDSRKTQLVVEVPSDAAKKGINEIKTEISGLADTVKREGEQAGKSLEGMGAGAQKSAKEIERAQANIISSIERATARIKSAEQGAAGFYETLAGQRGVNTDALRPYLEQLRQAEAAQKIATGGLGKMEVSAKQTAAALRNVPAQFTDIIVSLQGGQAPLTVLLQQGGQLKDMFGGIGPAARALGGFVAGLVSPFTLAAGAVGVLGVSYLKGAQEASEFNKTLILTGNAAGTTVGALSDMAQAVATLGGGTVGKAAEVLGQLAASGLTGANNLTRFAAAAIELERVGGPAASETAKAFKDLENEPLKAALKLNEATNFLSVSVLEQITALEQQGKTVQAAQVAQEAYAAAIESRSPAILGQLGLIERAWLGIKGATKQAGDALLSIGRQDTISQRIAELQKELQTIEGSRTVGRLAGRRQSTFDTQRDAIQAELTSLSRKLVLEQDIAAAQGAQTAQVKARADFDKGGEAFLSARVKLEREIAQARELGNAAGLTAAQIEQRIADIRTKAAGSGSKGGAGAAERERKAEISLLNQLAGATATYTEDVQRLVALRQKGTLTEAQYLEQLNALIAKQPFAKAGAKDIEDAQKAQAKASEEAAKAYGRYIDALGKSEEKQAKETAALGDQFIALTAGKEVLDELVITRREDALATAEQALFSAQLTNASAAELQMRAGIVQSLRDEIAIRRGIVTGTKNADASKAEKEAADKLTKAAERSAQQLEDSITDALLRGFENGKSIAENFRDVLQNTFKTLVLRPGIEAVVKGAGNLLPGSQPGAAGTPGAPGGNASVAAATSYLVALDAAANKQYATAIGTAAGQAIGGPIGASIGNFIGSAIDKAARGSAGSPGTGSVVSDTSGRLQTVRNDDSTFAANLNGSIDAALRAIVQASTGSIEAITGVATDATAKFATDGKRDAFGQFILSQAGSVTGFVGGAPASTTGGGEAQRFSADPNQGLEEFAAEVARVTREALEAADLPKFAREQLAKLGEGATLDELAAFSEGVKKTIEAVDTLQAAFLPLGGVFASIAGLSDDAFLALSKTAGGFEQFQGSINAYYAEFFSAAEKQEDQTRALTGQFGALGIALPKTREAFRALVEAQDLTTEAGRNQFASLVSLSGAFAELVPATEALAGAAGTTAEAIKKAAEEAAEAGRRSIASLTEERAQLEVDALRARGDTAGADRQQRSNNLAGLSAGVTESDRQAIEAIFDYNAALRAQIDALDAASQKAAEVAAERQTLEDRLLQAQGDTTAIRNRERAALDASNRALFDQVTALEAQQAASRDAAAAAATLAGTLTSTLGNLASTRFTLENQLLSLQGRGGEVTERTQARELSELTKGLAGADAARVIAAFELNVALQAEIESARALAEAQQEAQRANNELRKSYQGVTDAIFAEVARLRGLDTSASSGTFASAQAQFAITSAKARAGDQKAAEQLPALSQTLASLAETQAASNFELLRLRAQIAASLDTTGRNLGQQFGVQVPRLATGTNRVPSDMLALIHEGEAVIPKAFNPDATGAGSSKALLEEVRSLRGDFARLQAANDATAVSNAKVLQVLDQWNIEGQPAVRT